MLTSFKNWIASPFSSSMDAMHWFLFYGLLLVIAFSWHLIERSVRAA